MLLPVANLVIRDPRADGTVAAGQSHSIGLDFPLVDVDQSLEVAGPYQNSARKLSVWKTDSVTAIAKLNAVILACHAGSSNMDLAEWTQDSGLWKEVVPLGWQRRWLKFYDASADAAGVITSLSAFPQNPSWCCRFLRAQVPYGQVDPVELSITLNALGTVQYKVSIRQDTDIAVYDHYYPILYKSTDSGATWEAVDMFQRDDAARWANSAFERVEWIYCRFVPDCLIFNLGDLAEQWIYYEPGLDIPEGSVRVSVSGGQTAIFLHPATYVQTGTIERLQRLLLPELVADNTYQQTWLIEDRRANGNSLCSLETDGTYVWPKIVLGANTPYYHTPVAYRMQVTRPAVHDAAVDTVLFDNTTIGDKGKLEELEVTVAKDWRGSSFRARIRTATGADEYSFRGNEKAAVSTWLDDTVAPIVPVLQMTGYLDSPDYRRNTDPLIPLEIAGRDLFCRLGNKAAWGLPSFAGWLLSDAWTWLFHERANLPESLLAIDADAYDYELPNPYGDLILKYDATATIINVADQLAAAANREWGVNQSGQVFLRPLGSVQYSGVPDYTLDETTVTQKDHIAFVELTHDLFRSRNHFLVLGTNADGHQVLATHRSTDSVTDPSADPFFGDDWWEVRNAADGADPRLTAASLADELLRDTKFLKWQTYGKDNLFPDMYVAVRVGHLGVPADTVFRVVEKWSKLTFTRTEITYLTEIIGEVV